MKSFKAFTLAEVLVTLVVIGVIAALTIPSLLQNINDAQLRTQWQKAFSIMSQATNRIISDNAGFSDINNSSAIKNDYKTYLSVVKEDSNSHNIFSRYQSDYRCYKGGTADWAYPGGYPAVLLPDGTTVAFLSEEDNCTYSLGTTNICGYFVIDVNGPNPPNMWGKDLFDAWIVKDPAKGYKLVPMGSTGDHFTCVAGSSVSDTSQGCSAKALLNGPMP